MIMGLGGHWVFVMYSDGTVAIGNSKRQISPIEAPDCPVLYANLATCLAHRINRDRLMLAYARKKGHSINSKKGRKPRMTFVTFDEKFLPVAVTLGRSASIRYLDGKPLKKARR